MASQVALQVSPGPPSRKVGAGWGEPYYDHCYTKRGLPQTTNPSACARTENSNPGSQMLVQVPNDHQSKNSVQARRLRRWWPTPCQSLCALTRPRTCDLVDPLGGAKGRRLNMLPPTERGTWPPMMLTLQISPRKVGTGVESGKKKPTQVKPRCAQAS